MARQQNSGWMAIFQDNTLLEQYPEDGTDNTMELNKQVIPRMKELAAFFCCIHSTNQRVGIDFINYRFIIGDMAFPFYTPDEDVKLIYFVNRSCSLGQDGEVTEVPKIFVVGYEDSKGKMFLCMQEFTGEYFFTTDGVL